MRRYRKRAGVPARSGKAHFLYRKSVRLISKINGLASPRTQSRFEGVASGLLFSAIGPRPFCATNRKKRMARIPETCQHCGGASVTYCTVRGSQFVTRYRRCRICGETSKSISVNLGMLSRDFGHQTQDGGDTAGIRPIHNFERLTHGTG